jgi:DNA-binding PadR family transcriptional regulator
MIQQRLPFLVKKVDSRFLFTIRLNFSKEVHMKLKQILLGLIYLHPSVSGYDLKKIITQSTNFFFSAAYSQIYPALKEMNSEGLVTFEIEPLTGKQDRKVYTITEKGINELITWLKEPTKFTTSFSIFQDFLLKLTFMGVLDNESIISYLQSGLDFYREEAKKATTNHLSIEKDYIDADLGEKERYLILWNSEYEYILNDIQLKIDWIEKLIDSLKED